MKSENYKVISEFEEDNWWYKSKRNLIYRLIKNTGRSFDKALDAGCGVGSNFEVLKNFSKEVVGIDYSQEAIQYCKKKKYAKLTKMNIEKLEFDDNSFDLIVCSDVLEHVNDKKAITEIRRVLCPGGIFIFSVPAHRYLWGPTDRISNHLRRYEKRDVMALLKDKLEILKIGYWNFMMFFPNFVFLKMLSLTGNNKAQKNTLQVIPKFLNKIISFFVGMENRLFINYNLPQGVSIVGVCRKNE